MTGGTGFLGSRLARELVTRGWRVRVLARGAASLIGAGDEDNIQFIKGDIVDPSAAERAVEGVHLVFHLAAEKGVQRCEREPLLAVSTNVVGSWNLLKAASRAGVERIVAASSDKACEPTGILGLTKSLMEGLLCGPHEGPACTAVRLGGILESTGSVLDSWSRTRSDGFITVTDPEMTRFVQRSADAIALLIAVSGRASSAEVIAPALPAYRLGDLATAYARRHRVRTSIIGRGSGEKGHEQLVSASEAPFTRPEEGLFVITPGRSQDGAAPYSSREAPRLEADQLLDLVAPERSRA